MTGMGFELVAAITVGIGVAALLFAAMHAARKAGFSPPRWILPAGVGLSMIGYSVWNDYTWFDRARQQLPEGAELLAIGHDSQPWAPWTYLAPVVVRFATLDPGQISETGEGVKRARIMLIERRGPTRIVPQDFDCAKGMFSVAGGEWRKAETTDPAFGVVCEGEGG
ncbi:hypothetical protein [Paracoccus alkanivorans]|uniref:Uncharacterized protein n=1 Tax=Paracoccus alkanivorans TaxID=2116655 RepID=A0A3M0MFB6_9RHOB|nr:hypothetical protein [Paracoccus alkanivorans]RMC36376.1 hypothetical protein C9E81_06815 [Paracoccus alkanivorans]